MKWIDIVNVLIQTYLVMGQEKQSRISKQRLLCFDLSVKAQKLTSLYLQTEGRECMQEECARNFRYHKERGQGHKTSTEYLK